MPGNPSRVPAASFAYPYQVPIFLGFILIFILILSLSGAYLYLSSLVIHSWLSPGKVDCEGCEWEIFAPHAWERWAVAHQLTDHSQSGAAHGKPIRTQKDIGSVNLKHGDSSKGLDSIPLRQWQEWIDTRAQNMAIFRMFAEHTCRRFMKDCIGSKRHYQSGMILSYHFGVPLRPNSFHCSSVFPSTSFCMCHCMCCNTEVSVRQERLRHRIRYADLP